MSNTQLLLVSFLLIAGALIFTFAEDVKDFLFWANEFRKDHPYQFGFQMFSIALSLTAMVLSFI
jgi:hypothetical protein